MLDNNESKQLISDCPENWKLKNVGFIDYYWGKKENRTYFVIPVVYLFTYWGVGHELWELISSATTGSKDHTQIMNLKS